jgi:hypothetical protein
MFTMRISDNQKWKDQRHRQLSPMEKVVYDFLWDNCDRSGFYKVADTAMDCFVINCTEAEYMAALESLSAPKSINGGREHRGFVKVENTIWITHFLKYDQRNFGASLDPAHKPIIKGLISHQDTFSEEPEYLSLMKSITQEVLDRFKIELPISREIPDIPDAQERFREHIKSAKKKEPINIAWWTDTFKEITNKDVIMNPIIERNIRDLVREGSTTPNHVRTVFAYLHKVWGPDDKMKKFVTMETILNPDKFPGYLNQAINDKDGTAAYTPAHLRAKK